MNLGFFFFGLHYIYILTLFSRILIIFIFYLDSNFFSLFVDLFIGSLAILMCNFLFLINPVFYPLGDENTARLLPFKTISSFYCLSQQTLVNFVKSSLSIFVLFSNNWNAILKIASAFIFWTVFPSLGLILTYLIHFHVHFE